MKNRTTILEKKIVREVEKNREVVISLQNISKKYLLHHEKPTLVESVGKFFSLDKKEEYWPFKKINLEIHKGERIGIYGANGVGKTTLLKIIAGICSPTEGEVRTKGRIVSLIDLEAGFHPDLTGQENIFLNGLMVGMSRKEIESKFKQIVDFAEIGNFITAPLYTYSSGMKLRLGFSVAVYAEPDILLLDEVINLGDENFRNKSAKAITNLVDGRNDTTVVVVSQWIGLLEGLCDSIFLIKNEKF